MPTTEMTRLEQIEAVCCRGRYSYGRRGEQTYRVLKCFLESLERVERSCSSRDDLEAQYRFAEDWLADLFNDLLRAAKDT